MTSNANVAVAQLLKLTEPDGWKAIHEVAVASILSNSPFLKIPGTFPLRDLSQIPGSLIRPGYALRSGMFENSDADDLATLAHTHGIKWIADLRSEVERTRSPDPVIIGTSSDSFYTSLQRR